jgi:spore coat protein CotF
MNEVLTHAAEQAKKDYEAVQRHGEMLKELHAINKAQIAMAQRTNEMVGVAVIEHERLIQIAKQSTEYAAALLGM